MKEKKGAENTCSEVDNEFFRRLMVSYCEEMDSRSNDDYEVNPLQMKNLEEITNFLKSVTSETDKVYDDVKLVPKETVGYASAEYKNFALQGDSLEKFRKVLRYATAFGVDAKLDGHVVIGFTVPDVFVRKDGQSEALVVQLSEAAYNDTCSTKCQQVDVYFNSIKAEKIVVAPDADGFEAYFWTFSVNFKEEIEKFAEVLQKVSSIRFAPTADGHVCISVTVREAE